FELVFVAAVDDCHLQPEARRRRPCNADIGLSHEPVVRVYEYGDLPGGRDDLVQQLQLFGSELASDHGRPGRVAARPVETGDKPSRHGVGTRGEDDWNGLRGGQQLSYGGRVATDQYDCDPAAYEIDRHPGHPVQLTVGPAILDGDVAAVDEAGFTQASTERDHAVRIFRSRYAVEDSDHRHRRLLRARRERPRRRAAEERDELAPPHSITSSARKRNDSGIFRPNAFAVLTLIANSYLVGSCTGSSPGLAPRRTRSI